MLRIIFKGILYFILVYYLFRLVDKLLFGDRKVIEKERKRQEKERERIYKTYKNREGKVTINPGSRDAGKFRREEGDYIDYEEVK